MLGLEYLLVGAATTVFLAAAAIVVYDLYVVHGCRASDAEVYSWRPLRWRTGAALIALAWAPLLIAIIVLRSQA